MAFRESDGGGGDLQKNVLVGPLALCRAAAKLVLAATHERTLQYAPLEAQKAHAIDVN